MKKSIFFYIQGRRKEIVFVYRFCLLSCLKGLGHEMDFKYFGKDGKF
jgi:hypothetical protein